MAICAFAIIRNDKNQILLEQLAPPFAEAHKWNFPGGVIEEGEEILEGLVREVKEETNILCSVNERRDQFVTKNGVDEINIYNATYISGDIVVQEDELLDAGWFSVDEALKLPLAFNIRDYVTKIKHEYSALS